MHKEPIMGSHVLPYRETGASGASHYPWWAFCVLSLVLFINKSQKNYFMSEVEPVKKKWYKTWYGIVGIIFVVGIIGNLLPESTPKAEDVSSIPVKEEVVEPAIKVTAVKLASDYEANEVSADANYKGKTLEVTGTISTIGKDILDTPYVALSDGKQYSITSIQCMFDKSDQDQLTSLSKDTKITLQGRGAGKLGNILLRECSIVK
jgi:hypothetical protein